MTITLHLKPDVEAGLSARAQANGMGLEEYLMSLVEVASIPETPDMAATEPIGREEAIRRMVEFGERYGLSLGEPITRKLLHEGHRI